MNCLCELGSARNRRVGGKARQLRELSALGGDIPKTWICDWRAHAAWIRGDRHVEQALRNDLTRLLDRSREYVVRSSADVEDGSRWSYAGRFDSFLRVRGVDQLVAAVKAVWESAERAGRSVRMAVMVQEMVPARVSGVAFSRNPMTGAKEVIIEAVVGTSEALTGGIASPERWIVAEGDEIEAPAGAAVGVDILQEIVDAARTFEGAVGHPVDLEWAVDGNRLVWLQMRPISVLQTSDVYSNRISKEFLPGLIMPLVWSINVPMVNRAWLNLLEEIIGPIDMDPAKLARRIGCRAYFNMGRMGELFAIAGMRRDVLEAMMGFTPKDESSKRTSWITIRMLRHVPRLARFAWRHWRFRPRFARWLPPVNRQLDSLREQAFHSQAERQLLEEVDHLLTRMQQIAYYRIVSMLRHAAIHGFVARGLAKKGISSQPAEIVGYDAAHVDVDPSRELSELRATFSSLPEVAQRRLRGQETEGIVEDQKTREFLDALERFLERFGYLSDRGNDFSAVTWKENPSLVLNLLAAGQDDPEDGDRIVEDSSPSKWPRTVKRLARKEARARFDRDRVGALFSRGHEVLRRLFLELGRRLQQGGIIDAPADIFLMTYDEIRAVTRNELSTRSARRRVRERREEMRQAENAELPEVVYGEQIPGFRAERPMKDVLYGVAASRGFYEGPARIVRSVEEFDRVRAEDVLVIPHSDIGWMPLLDKASAIVAESGGLLSHSAIVARERGIPAVVSVMQAQSIPDGAWVAVDGSRGTISLCSESIPAER